MKLLVLGGTVFLGRHLVDAALDAGHELTLFNRGKSAPELFADVEKITGDRERDLTRLGGRRWDAVIDTCGYLPGVVRESARTLRDQVGLYVFVSTVSVYKDWNRRDQDENAPLHEPIVAEGAAQTPENYGGLKAGCEKALEGASLVVRPGLIVGPHDPTDRFTYWPARVARGGEVLAPGSPDRSVQVIDVRDLARWIVGSAGARLTGTFNACGPGAPMGEILRLCAKAAGKKSRLTWVGDEFLLEQGVAPYAEMPLWIPSVNDSFISRRAMRTGLAFRPLLETIKDTLAWDSSRSKDRPWRNGLRPDREAELLALWRRAKAVIY